MQVSMPITLYIVSPDGDVSVDPVNTTASNGSTVSFNCSTTAGDGNSFTWMREDFSELSNSEDVTITADSSQSTLTINGVNATQHGGMYTCVVSNAAGDGSETGTLYVAPVITVQPISTLLTRDSEVEILECMAESFPNPIYRWEKLTNGQFSSVPNGNSSLLSFDPVMFGNEGMYQCVAVSLAGMANSIPSTVVGKCHCMFTVRQLSCSCYVYLHFH